MTPCTRRTAALVFLAMVLTGPATAQPSTAEAFLASIYTPYLDKSFMGHDCFDHADRFFVPDLANALNGDQDRNAGMVGKLDFDPFIVGQAWEISNLSISVTTDGAKATGEVAFVNIGRPRRVVYDLVRTPAGWRIADVKWPERINGAETLRGLYRLK